MDRQRLKSNRQGRAKALRRAGFSLLELMVALTILAIALVPVAYFYTKSLQMVEEAGIRTRALMLAPRSVEAYVGRALVYYGDALLAAGEEEEGKRRYAEALRAWLARVLEDLIGQHIAPRLVRACGSVDAAQAYLQGLSG